MRSKVGLVTKSTAGVLQGQLAHLALDPRSVDGDRSDC
jgi:hypothetical protein